MAERTIKFHSLVLEISKNITLTLQTQLRPEGALCGELGQSFSTSASLDVTERPQEVILNWDGTGSLKITHKEPQPGNHRYDFFWESIKPKSLIDSYEFGVAQWYGAAQIKQQMWPLNKWKRKSTAYVCGNSFDNDYGGVQERYWLNSNGVAIFVDEDVPLFVSMNYNNDRKITFTSKYDTPYVNLDKSKPKLLYTILQSMNVRKAHEFAIREVFAKPTDIPNEDIFRYPIWSTWAQYKKNINQKTVLEFAQKIKDLGFKASQVEIDDDWTPSYGDMEFDKSKFPGAQYMVQQIHDMGFKVTVWVHPFASPKSSAARKDYWVKGSLKGVTTWWNGLGKSLDVTNPAAVAWYKGCLQVLKNNTGIDSFKFDAGEVNWLPSGAKFHQEMSSPNTYTKKYAELCASIDTTLRAQEVRVAFRTQHLPVFVRMMDKDSLWGYENGLKSLIPHALTFSIIGYPFVLPDMIGGNAYKGMPDKELYIRWLQANALLPSIQYSIVPWQYDDETVEIAKKMDALHEKYSDLIITLARMAVHTGEPIIRPIWWNAPYDEHALACDDEFLLGEDILVAPVLEKSARSRAIYLPPGSWKDLNNGKILSGGRWVYDYPAQLDELPHFLHQEVKVKRKPKPPKKEEEGAKEEDEADAPQPEQLPEEPLQPEQLPEPPKAAAGGDSKDTPMDMAEELRQKLAEFWARRMTEEGVFEGDEFGTPFLAHSSKS